MCICEMLTGISLVSRPFVVKPSPLMSAIWHEAPLLIIILIELYRYYGHHCAYGVHAFKLL